MDDMLLAATYQRVILLRGAVRHTIEAGDGPYFGITWNADRLFIGARQWDTSEYETIHVFDRNLEPVDIIELPGVRQLHQILWHDGFLYVTNTLADRVMRLSDAGLETVYHAEREIAEIEGDDDRRHINSIWHDGERFHIVELHGAIKTFSNDWQLERVVTQPYELHGVYIEDGKIYTCASNMEAVLRIGIDDGETDVIPVGGHLGIMQDAGDLYQAYTRGIARRPGRWYIGASAIRDEREARAHGDSAILAFDDDWSFIEAIRLPDTGQLNGVRILGNDLAHGSARW